MKSWFLKGVRKKIKSSIDLQKCVCVKIKNELEKIKPFQKALPKSLKSAFDPQNRNIEKFARDLKIPWSFKKPHHENKNHLDKNPDQKPLKILTFIYHTPLNRLDIKI